MNTPKQKPWWTAVILSAGAFVVMSLAYVAAGFGEQASPVNQVLNRHGGTMILALAGVTIGNGMLAMWLDQRERRVDPKQSPDPDGSGDLP
jgi:hypothetical protein